MKLEDRILDIEKSSSLKKTLKKFSWWDWTKIIGFNAAGAAFSGGLFGYGALNTLATTASFVTSNYISNRKRGFTKKSLQSDLVLGSTYTPAIYKFLGIIDTYSSNPMKWMAAYAMGMYPFTVATRAMKHIIDKYSPWTFFTGIFKGEPIKDLKYIAKDAITESVPSSAKAAAYLTLPVAASKYLLPNELLIAALYPLRTAYRYILDRQDQNKRYTHSYNIPQAA